MSRRKGGALGNCDGFSLTEMLVGLFLTGVVMLGAATLMTNSMKSVQALSQSRDLREIVAEAREALKDKLTCRQNFAMKLQKVGNEGLVITDVKRFNSAGAATTILAETGSDSLFKNISLTAKYSIDSSSLISELEFKPKGNLRSQKVTLYMQTQNDLVTDCGELASANLTEQQDICSLVGQVYNAASAVCEKPPTVYCKSNSATEVATCPVGFIPYSQETCASAKPQVGSPMYLTLATILPCQMVSYPGAGYAYCDVGELVDSWSNGSGGCVGNYPSAILPNPGAYLVYHLIQCQPIGNAATPSTCKSAISDFQ